MTQILTNKELNEDLRKILAFPNSHFVKREGNKILIRKDDLTHKLSELICIDYHAHQIHTSKINPEFSDFLWANKLHKELVSKSISIVKKQCFLKYGEIPQHNYSNIDKFPELKEFFNKSHKCYQLSTYECKNCLYKLSVWHDQAYILSRRAIDHHEGKGDVIKAICVDETYALQEGNHHTYVWAVGNGYFVYNSGDVFSTVAVM